MTEQASGSSLPQTQGLGREQRDSDHSDWDNLHTHTHTHVHFRNIEAVNRRHPKTHPHHRHTRSPKEDDAPVRRRDEPEPSPDDVVIIIQTISVLQLTDSTGSTFIQTLSPNTTSPSALTETPAGPTTAVSVTEADPAPGNPSKSTYQVSPSSASSGDGASDSSPSSTPSLVEQSTATPPGSSMPASFPTLTYAPITSSRLTPTHVFPSLSGVYNTTQAVPAPSPISSNSTASLHSLTAESDSNFTLSSSTATTSHSTTSSLSTGLSSSGTHTKSGKSTSSSHSGVTYILSTVHPESTGQSPSNNGIGAPTGTVVVGGGPPPTDTSSSLNSDDNNNNTSTPPGTIAGSVVGAVSGFAFILILAAALLRWRKRRTGRKLIQASGNDGGYGTVATRGSGGPGGDGMSERGRPAPFAIPAALANLTGQSRFSRSTVSSDGGERGFTKISGRKLPPVLQFGGDGYTDPRATMMSDQSIEYRASQQFFGEAPLSRLALGSPMLSESGIPIFHESPARTPVATPGHFSDPFSDANRVESPPPTQPRPDPVGRSHAPRDGSTRSHGSFSKFTEGL
ncbi:hypothetical protein F5Y17DRAFT_420356 [Xylariaceae sp. FL0594]|nr:hypothetical protein F5Y17DRAFT_420356 [Xylariaceae sp. FL0594]